MVSDVSLHQEDVFTALQCRKTSDILVLTSPTPLHPAKHTDSRTAHAVSTEWRQDGEKGHR